MEEKKTGLERYQLMLVNWVSATFTVEALVGKNSISLSESDYELMDTVFRRFTELTDSIDRLDLCLSFITGPMPRRKGLKVDDYLLYHITFYMQEAYILNERFEAYAKSVVRLRKRRIGLDGIDLSQLTGLQERIRNELAPLVQARGSHVHARAFRDQEMRELSAFSFLAAHDLSRSDWRPIASQLYSISRATWVEKLELSRQAVAKILDEYCDLMHEVVTGGVKSLLFNKVQDDSV